MRVLVDSNILLRTVQPTHAHYQLAVDATDRLRQVKDDIFVVPQNIYEFWSVATRPTNVNGLGFTAGQVEQEVVKIKRFFNLVDDTPSIFAEWERLVSLHAVIGKNVHDARLVAAMLVHGITHLLTFNTQDFVCFTAIAVIDPADVVKTSPP